MQHAFFSGTTCRLLCEGCVAFECGTSSCIQHACCCIRLLHTSFCGMRAVCRHGPWAMGHGPWAMRVWPVVIFCSSRAATLLTLYNNGNITVGRPDFVLSDSQRELGCQCCMGHGPLPRCLTSARRSRRRATHLCQRRCCRFRHCRWTSTSWTLTLTWPMAEAEPCPRGGASSRPLRILVALR